MQNILAPSSESVEIYDLYADAGKLESRSWVTVTAEITAEKHYLYQGELGPVLTALSVEPAEPAQQDVATF